MSQPPLSYQSLNVPQGPQKPTMLMVVGILGIVFGGLGVLCIGGGEIFTVFAFFNPALSRATAGQPMAQKAMNVVLGLVSIVVCGVLLWGSIGAINLKPAARRLMIGWAIADMVYDFIRLVIVIVMAFAFPIAQNAALQQNPAFANNPRLISYARLAGVAFAVVWWAISTGFAILTYVCYRKPEVVAAFETPLRSGSPLPPPPI